MKVISAGFSIKQEDAEVADLLDKAKILITDADNAFSTPTAIEYIEYDAPARTLHIGLVEA